MHAGQLSIFGVISQRPGEMGGQGCCPVSFQPNKKKKSASQQVAGSAVHVHTGAGE